uniref:Dystrophin n=1 Tax=Eptatretus burgeri TaxID=7764 RepID=A0A8C4R324_EPTBU
MFDAQIRSRHTALVAALERSRELWKDLTEMQEWLNQAEEEYFGKDHEYKVPTDLSQAVAELKHAMDEVKQKEVKVKILKDGVGTVVATGAGTGRDKLKAELATVMANYQRLCSRLKGKHSMVQVNLSITSCKPDIGDIVVHVIVTLSFLLGNGFDSLSKVTMSTPDQCLFLS